MNVSKELLSEVLGYAVSNIYIAPNGNFIEAQSKYRDERINIYELQHSCKEWVISKGYDILSGGLEAGLFSCYIDYADKRYTLQMEPLHHEFADTEPEAVFKATSYIMEQLKQKD